MTCGVGRRHDSILVLPWLWLAAAAPTQLLAWKLPYAAGIALKKRGGTNTHWSPFPVIKHFFIMFVFSISCILLGAYAKYRKVSKHTPSLKCDSHFSHLPLDSSGRNAFPCNNGISNPVGTLDMCTILDNSNRNWRFWKSYSKPEFQFPRQIIHADMYTYMHAHTESLTPFITETF